MKGTLLALCSGEFLAKKHIYFWSTSFYYQQDFCFQAALEKIVTNLNYLTVQIWPNNSLQKVQVLCVCVFFFNDIIFKIPGSLT